MEIDMKKHGDNNLQYLYQNREYCWCIEGITLNTKIKILDKPIIKPLDDLDLTNARSETNARKINEIIRYINRYINNKEDKDE